MTRPTRIRLSRKKGFRLQGHSKALNGLECVNVARPSKWGNPYVIGKAAHKVMVLDAVDAVLGFRLLMSCVAGRNYPTNEQIKFELQGKNLACWCALDAPCHADILLKLANKDTE